MAIKRIDEYTVEYSERGTDLKVTVRTSDEYCTIYNGDKPAATMQRRRMTDRGYIHHKDGNPLNHDPANLERRENPKWKVYATDGSLIGSCGFVGTALILTRHHLCL